MLIKVFGMDVETKGLYLAVEGGGGFLNQQQSCKKKKNPPFCTYNHFNPL